MSGLATVIPGEASETDDDDENGNNGNSNKFAREDDELMRFANSSVGFVDTG